MTLTATVAPDNATNKNLTWSSGDENVATVNAGTVTGVAEGTATILVKSESNPDKTASCTVTVVSAATAKVAKASAGTYTIGDTVITINADGSTTATKNGDEVAAKVTVEGGSVTITLGEGDTATTYTASKTADGKIDTETVKDSGGNTVEVEFTEAEDENDDEKVEEDDSSSASFFAWTASEDTTFTASTDNITENTDFGAITIGADTNNAVQRDAARIKLPARAWPTSFVAKDGSLNAVRVIRFKASKGTQKITVTAAPASTSSSGNITITDGDKDSPKCLATKALPSFEKGATPPQSDVVVDFDTALEADTYIYILNLKTGGTTPTGFTEGDGGTIGIYKIAVSGTEKEAQDAPAATDFAVEAPASASAKGKITYSGEKIANLQYKDGDDWYKWGTEKAKEFAAGKVYVRYGSDDTHKASDATELTVPEYVNLELTAATAPTAGSVTATATTSAADNDGTLTVDTTKEARALEYKVGDGNWTAFEDGKASGLASGTYTIRTAAKDGEWNASTETISVVVKKFTAAPKASDFTVKAASSETANDGAITAKTAAAVENLMIVGVGEGGADVAWATLAGTETPLVVTVPAGTYSAYYAETETTAKSASGEIVVDYDKYFNVVGMQFDATSIRALAGVTNTNDYNVTSDVVASDGTWKVTGVDSKTYFQLKYKDKNDTTAGFETYDYDANASTGYKWASRLSFNKKTAVKLLLKVGAGTRVVLRVDGGSVKDAPNTGVTNFTFKGAGDAVVWNPLVSLSTKYVTVTGDADGYVTITSTDTTNGANIYGITVVSAEVDTSTSVRKDGEGDDVTVSTAAVYNVPTISNLSADSANQGTTITATAAATVTVSKTQKVYADGHLGDAVEGTETVDTSTIKWYAKGSAADATESEIGTGATFSWATTTETAVDTYSVVAKYTIGEKTYTSEAVSVRILDASKTYVTITFDKGDGTLTGDAPAQKVASGEATALTAFAGLGITPPSGKEFDGWATASDGEKVHADGASVTVSADTTLYAVYKDASVTQWHGTLDLSPTGDTVADDQSDLTTAFKTVKTITKKDENNYSQTFSINANGTNSVSIADEKGLKFQNGENLTFATKAISKITLVVECSNNSRTTTVTGPAGFSTVFSKGTDAPTSELYTYSRSSNVMTLVIKAAGAGDWKVETSTGTVYIESISIAVTE